MATDSQPRPCPFCGAPAVALAADFENMETEANPPDGLWVVECYDGCGARGPLAGTEDEAWARWDQRGLTWGGYAPLGAMTEERG